MDILFKFERQIYLIFIGYWSDHHIVVDLVGMDRIFIKNRTFPTYLNLSMGRLKPINIFLFLMATVLCGTFYSCQEKSNANSGQEQQQKRKLSLSEKLEIPELPIIPLLPEAAKESSKWLAYITARAEMKRFQKFTVQDVVDRAATISEIMKALQATVPKKFQEKPVLARINVLVTLSNVLKQTAENPNATSQEIRTVAEKIPIAFRNLKIQLNEVFRKSLEDFQQELLGNDTVRRIELNEKRMQTPVK